MLRWILAALLLGLAGSPAMSQPLPLVCAGVDDTAAVTAAVSAANTGDVPLMLPAGVCRYNDTIILYPGTPVIGEGRGTSRLLYCGTDDAIRIEPIVGGGMANYNQVLRDFSVEPCGVETGDNGIEVRLPVGGYYAYAVWDRLWIGRFGGYGIWLNNTVNNHAAFWNIQVHDSFVGNGIKGTKIGDSVGFFNVTVHGRNNVWMSGIPGAVLFQFIGGQVTTSDGQMHLYDMAGVRIENAWFEHPSYMLDPVSANMMSLLLVNTYDVEVDGLVIFPHPGPVRPYAHGIALVGAHHTVIDGVNFTAPGWSTHIYGTTTTTDTTITDGYYNGVAPDIVLQGS